LYLLSPHLSRKLFFLAKKVERLLSNLSTFSLYTSRQSQKTKNSVYLDPNAIIAILKLTEYLLIPLPKDDKSEYLAQGGYTLANWQRLEQDLRQQILSLEAQPTLKTQYGQKYQIISPLICPNGKVLTIKTIWIVTDQTTQFVTLFPA
jgi:hypothetical protein